MKKKLYLPIEFLVRELDSKLLIAVKLLIDSKNDWEIFIGKNKKISKYIHNKNKIPFIWLDKGIEIDDSKLRKIIHNNGRAILLDEEGGVFTKNHSIFPRTREKLNHAAHYYDKIFLWGKKRYDDWIDKIPNFEKSKLYITGNPRFDLSKNKFRDYFIKINKDLPNKNYTIISTAFGSANRKISFNKDSANYWNSVNEDSINKLDFKISDYQKKLFKPYLSGVEKLISDFPNEFFYLRPHPTEDLTIYNKIFNKYSNVRLINDKSIQEWLPKAKALIHNGCTTAIEAFCYGINPICFAPYRDINNEQYLTFDISEITENYTDFKKVFQDRLKKNDNKTDNIILDRNNKEAYASSYIHNIKNLNSYELITDIIDKINFNKKDYKITFYEKIKYMLPFNLYNLISKIKYNFISKIEFRRFKKDLKNYDKIKFSNLSQEDIQIRIEAFLNFLNCSKKIQILKAENNVYELRLLID